MMPAAVERGARATSAKVYKGHIPELDALRAFGIVAVIVAHMWPKESFRIWETAQLAWICMDSFFVMSGFLITGILLDSRTRSDYYSSYYIRRALRILPVYYAMLVVLTAADALGFRYSGTVHSAGSPWWFFIYLGNIPTALTGQWMEAARGAFVPLWSLQIEEQFYLLFPLLVHRMSLKTLSRTVLTLAVISPVLRLFFYWADPANTLVQYVFLPCRMEGLALGAWIAIRFRLKPWELSRRRLSIGAAVLLAITCLLGGWSGFEHIHAFNRTLGFLISSIACVYVVLWLIAFRGSRVTACLRLAPVQHLGKISYGAYLIHLPIAVIVTSISSAWGIGWLGQGFAKLGCVFVLTVAVASLSWHFFESPLLRMKDRLSATVARPAAELPSLRPTAQRAHAGVE